MNNLKVYVVGGGTDRYFRYLNSDDYSFISTHRILDADVVLFTGGEDINPNFYGQKPGSRTIFNKSRDDMEWEVINHAIKNNKFLFGICRGGQLICARAGGLLIQHVTGHSGNHNVFCKKDDTIITNRVNSIHHQMMFPYNIKRQERYDIFMWSTQKLRLLNTGNNYFVQTYQDGDNNELVRNGIMLKHEMDFKEPEGIYFPDISGLAVQFHPEMLDGAWVDWEKKTINYLKEMFILYYNKHVEKLTKKQKINDKENCNSGLETV